jgi:flagellin
VKVAIGDARAQALGVAGLAVGDPATLAALDQAQGMLASQRARLGAIDNALTHWQNAAATTRANTEAARSRIEDVDVAAAVAGATRDRILTDLLLGSHRVTEHSRARVFDLLG